MQTAATAFINSSCNSIQFRPNPEMPDSPPDNKAVALSPSAAAAPSGAHPLGRVPSAGSSIGLLNGGGGALSPLGSMNGRTPSPPSLGNSSAAQQLPPACGARQLSKLKRFLTTLQTFGSDISPEIGERVRGLVLALVNSHISIEEFHAKLQEATNFPLRPFVIPFLKANLPLLQRELLHCARMAKQTPAQYLAHNEHLLFDAANHSPSDVGGGGPAAHGETHELNSSSSSASDAASDSLKRKSPDDRPKENGLESGEQPSKRIHTLSPGSSLRTSPAGPFTPLHGNVPVRMDELNASRELRERELRERELRDRESRDRERIFSSYGTQQLSRIGQLDHYDLRLEEDLKNIDSMMTNIVEMVGKCRRAMTQLKERVIRDHEEMALWLRRPIDGSDKAKMMLPSPSMQHRTHPAFHDERITDIKVRAGFPFPEEAVNEVKRQAVAELQKAVAAAETKASEMVAAERSKMESVIAEARTKAAEEILTTLNHQEESSESCWNCGRRASETCSGCNIARYCGSFCQHKDWENHHHVCGQNNANARAQSGTSQDKLSDTSRACAGSPTGSAASPAPRSSASTPKSNASRSSTPTIAPAPPEKKAIGASAAQ